VNPSTYAVLVCHIQKKQCILFNDYRCDQLWHCHMALWSKPHWLCYNFVSFRAPQSIFAVSFIKEMGVGGVRSFHLLGEWYISVMQRSLPDINTSQIAVKNMRTHCITTKCISVRYSLLLLCYELLIIPRLYCDCTWQNLWCTEC